MQSNDNIELSQTSSIRFFPGVSNGNANPPIAMGAMRKKTSNRLDPTPDSNGYLYYMSRFNLEQYKTLKYTTCPLI